MRDDNVILGLFAREGYEQHDTSRQCCDGRCNDNQGRGGCPRVPESMPERTSRKASPAAFGIFSAICVGLAVLWVIGLVAQAVR
jgi:hypothetical protein